MDALPRQRGDRFAARTGLDPRGLATPYRRLRTSPCRIQAWREVNELPGRELRRSQGEPDVPLEAGQIESGDADGDREGGPAERMETR